MRTTLAALIGCFAILLSGASVYAMPSSYEAADVGYQAPLAAATYATPSCGSGGGCSTCCPYGNNCQCTDPYCKSSDRSCIGECRCCEAFGNVGAR